jgi:hypothetical protein
LITLELIEALYGHIKHCSSLRCTRSLGASWVIAIVARDLVGKQNILDLDAGADVVDDERPAVSQAVRDEPDMGDA